MNPGSGSGANRQPPSSSKRQSEDSGEEPNRRPSCLPRAEDETDQWGRTALHLAALVGDVERVRVLLERGLDARVRDYKGYTPLHLAAENGNAEVIRKLLAAGADVNLKEGFGETPLHVALLCKKEAAAELLAGVGGPNDTPDRGGFRPLHLAAAEGYIQVTKKLLSGGARPHMRDHYRNHPISYALRNERDRVARLILASCAWNDVAIDWKAVECSPRGTERGIRMLSECAAEIRRMRETRVPESMVTFFDVSWQHPCRVAPRFRVETIRRVEEGNSLMMEFPIYAALISSKLARVRERRVLADRCVECFSRMHPPLPALCAEVVLFCLTEDEMRNFLRAVEPRARSED